MSPPPGADWAALFFNPDLALADRLQRYASRCYPNSPDADAAFNYALEAVSANDWQRLRDGYSGAASAPGFLVATFQHLISDYARRKYPRVRPPAFVRAAGELWLAVWRRLCLEREHKESIIDALGGALATRRREVTHAITQIKGRVPNCGAYTREQLAPEDGESAPERTVAPAMADPSRETEAEELGELLQALRAVILDDAQAPQAELVQRREDFSKLRETLSLQPEELLLLRLKHEREMSLAAAAKVLGMHPKKATRTYAAVLKRLRAALAPLGLASN